MVQRYGSDIGGGSELHARYIAEHVAAHADVRVLTTCARDYVTWRNEYPDRRGARKTGSPSNAFAKWPASATPATSRGGRRSWSSTSIRCRTNFRGSRHRDRSAPEAGTASSAQPGNSTVVAFSLRYHTAYHAARLSPGRAVLVPTTERDPAFGLTILGPELRAARDHGQLASKSARDAGGRRRDDGGPRRAGASARTRRRRLTPERARRLFGLANLFIVHVGRIDANKGSRICPTTSTRFSACTERLLDLGADRHAGAGLTPDHPRIRHLGYVSDADKFADVIAGAEALVMPSPFGLPMVALEAWALGRPVLANGRCDVLAGNSAIAANAGLRTT